MTCAGRATVGEPASKGLESTGAGVEVAASKLPARALDASAPEHVRVLVPLLTQIDHPFSIRVAHGLDG